MSKDAVSLEKKKLNEALYINKSVFGENINPLVYETKHYGNPYRLDESFSISYEGQKAAGVAAFLGMRFISSGEIIPVYQCMDVSVLKECQGKGHFSKALVSFSDHDNGSRFIFALPNSNSFPGFIKNGYTSPLRLCHFLYFTAPFSFVLGKNVLSDILDGIFKMFFSIKAEKTADGETLTLHEGMKSIPVSDDEIEKIYSGSKCHFLHDEKIYRWKQAYNPDLKFHWAVLRKKDGTLLGYALCHLRARMKGSFVIIDDFAAYGDISTQKSIMKQLLFPLSKLGNITEIPFVNNSKDGALLKTLHFINGCNFPFKLRGGPTVLSPDCKYTKEILDCSFRNIDSDVI